MNHFWNFRFARYSRSDYKIMSSITIDDFYRTSYSFSFCDTTSMTFVKRVGSPLKFPVFFSEL